MESISRDKSELKKIVSKVIPNLIVSKAIPNLFEIDTLSGLRSSDMKPLEICIDSALQSQNPAEATAEFFTPGMLLGTAVENNHHLGAMFAQFGLDCIGIKRAEEAAKAAAAAEMQVQDQSELSDFLDSADFCTIM